MGVAGPCRCSGRARLFDGLVLRIVVALPTRLVVRGQRRSRELRRPIRLALAVVSGREGLGVRPMVLVAAILLEVRWQGEGKAQAAIGRAIEILHRPILAHLVILSLEPR